MEYNDGYFFGLVDADRGYFDTAERYAIDFEYDLMENGLCFIGFRGSC